MSSNPFGQHQPITAVVLSTMTSRDPLLFFQPGDDSGRKKWWTRRGGAYFESKMYSDESGTIGQNELTLSSFRQQECATENTRKLVLLNTKPAILSDLADSLILFIPFGSQKQVSFILFTSVMLFCQFIWWIWPGYLADVLVDTPLDLALQGFKQCADSQISLCMILL